MLTTSNAAGVIQCSDATGFDVAAIETTDAPFLLAAGAVTQSSAIAATGLALTGTSGAYTLNDAGSANAAGVSTGGQLINNVGTGGIVAPSGRYLAYSGNPGSTTEGVTG